MEKFNRFKGAAAGLAALGAVAGVEVPTAEAGGASKIEQSILDKSNQKLGVVAHSYEEAYQEKVNLKMDDRWSKAGQVHVEVKDGKFSISIFGASVDAPESIEKQVTPHRIRMEVLKDRLNLKQPLSFEFNGTRIEVSAAARAAIAAVPGAELAKDTGTLTAADGTRFDLSDKGQNKMLRMYNLHNGTEPGLYVCTDEEAPGGSFLSAGFKMNLQGGPAVVTNMSPEEFRKECR